MVILTLDSHSTMMVRSGFRTLVHFAERQITPWDFSSTMVETLSCSPHGTKQVRYSLRRMEITALDTTLSSNRLMAQRSG